MYIIVDNIQVRIMNLCIKYKNNIGWWVLHVENIRYNLCMKMVALSLNNVVVAGHDEIKIVDY